VTGIDLPAESNGNLPGLPESLAAAGKRWRLGDTYNVSIGQGDLLVTPLQLANFIGAIANGGTLYRPFLARELGSKVIADYTKWHDEFSAVQRGLEDAVEKPYGSSHLLASLPFRIAGKTGTPQTHNRAKTNAFFIGYGPVEAPELVVLVFVEDAREGSLNALPVARDVFRWYYENRMNNAELK
jgi:penicillin-binding protein 2